MRRPHRLTPWQRWRAWRLSRGRRRAAARRNMATLHYQMHRSEIAAGARPSEVAARCPYRLCPWKLATTRREA